MEYKVEIPQFEGPLDLLLHLIKLPLMNLNYYVVFAKTLKRINAYKPHTCVYDMESIRIPTQMMSVVAIPFSLKLSDFLPRIKAETLSSKNM